MLDELIARQIKPQQLWADRGYDGEELRQQLLQRGVTPVISRRRRPNDPVADDTPTVRRANRLRPRPIDPNGRHRWPIERTNSWLRNWRRVATRWEHRPENWQAMIQIAAALTIYDMIERSFP